MVNYRQFSIQTKTFQINRKGLFSLLFMILVSLACIISVSASTSDLSGKAPTISNVEIIGLSSLSSLNIPSTAIKYPVTDNIGSHNINEATQKEDTSSISKVPYTSDNQLKRIPSVVTHSISPPLMPVSVTQGSQSDHNSSQQPDDQIAMRMDNTDEIGKVSSAPGIKWEKSLGGSGYDGASSIQQTSDGGYIVAGFTESNDGNVIGNHGGYRDFWVVKLSDSGTIQWQKCLGGSNWEEAFSIRQTRSGGYIVAGFTGSTDGDVSENRGNLDYWIVNLDNTGTITWERCLGGVSMDEANSIWVTTDDGYIATGYVYSNDHDVSGNHNLTDFWVVKLSSPGGIEWQKCLGGTKFEYGKSIQQTRDDGYIVAGKSGSNDNDVSGNHGDNDFWIVKLSDTGDISWQKSLGGTGSDIAYSIRQTNDDGYIVAGETNSNDNDVSGNHGKSDIWVVKLTSSGTIQWQKCLGGSNTDEAYSIQQTGDGGYIVAGMTESGDGDVSGKHIGKDYWIVKLTSTGTVQWQKCLGGNARETAYSIQETSDGGYIVAGESSSVTDDVSGNHGKLDFWIVKLEKPQENPTINIITPVSGYNTGNVAATITGTNFRTGAKVKLLKGTTTRAATVRKIESSKIICTLPLTNAPTGKYNLIITNTDGTSATKYNAFTVIPAKSTITTIKPNSGLSSKNIKVTITGTNFRTGVIVQMVKGNIVKKAKVTSCSATKIVCTLPTKGIASGLWNIKITNADKTTITKKGGFTVKKLVTAGETGAGQVSGHVVSIPVSAPQGSFPSPPPLSGATGVVPIQKSGIPPVLHA